MNHKKKIFIDFDGVICDTNTLKEKNIKEAYKYVFGEYNIDFVQFFTKNNGVPRELKLKQYFNSPTLEEKILKKYFSLNILHFFSYIPIYILYFTAPPFIKQLFLIQISPSSEIFVFTPGRGFPTVPILLLGGILKCEIQQSSVIP